MSRCWEADDNIYSILTIIVIMNSFMEVIRCRNGPILVQLCVNIQSYMLSMFVAYDWALHFSAGLNIGIPSEFCFLTMLAVFGK